MPYLTDLHHAIQRTLGSGRVGQPVFVRYHLDGLLPNDWSVQDIADTVEAWIGPGDVRAIAAGSADQPGVFLKFANGATALVSTVPRPGSDSRLDVTILGTHGAIYHPLETGIDTLWEDDAPVAESTPGQYGILLVSGGRTHQETYAAAFAADPRCRIIAVTDEADIDAQRREWNEQLAKSLGVPYLADLEAALARDDVQVVSICALPERRGRIAVRCAQAGKHLYLDKSLAPSIAEADAIVAAVQAAGVRSQMYSFVTTPWARRARQLLQAAGEKGDCPLKTGGQSPFSPAHRLGRLLAIHSDIFFAKGHAGTAHLEPRREEYPPTRHQLVEAKRELDNVGVYPISLVRWLTGQEFRSVWAVTGNYFFAEHQRHNVEDFGVLAGLLGDGTPVTIACGRTGWSSHPASGVKRVIVVGSERTLVIDAHRPRLEVHAAEPPWTPPPPHPGDPMAFWDTTQAEAGTQPRRTWLPLWSVDRDVRSFLDALDAGRDGEVNAAEAARTTAVLLAAYRSAATEERVGI